MTMESFLYWVEKKIIVSLEFLAKREGKIKILLYKGLEDCTQTLAEKTSLPSNSERRNVNSVRCVTQKTVVIQQKNDKCMGQLK